MVLPKRTLMMMKMKAMMMIKHPPAHGVLAGALAKEAAATMALVKKMTRRIKKMIKTTTTMIRRRVHLHGPMTGLRGAVVMMIKTTMMIRRIHLPPGLMTGPHGVVVKTMMIRRMMTGGARTGGARRETASTVGGVTRVTGRDGTISIVAMVIAGITTAIMEIAIPTPPISLSASVKKSPTMTMLKMTSQWMS